MESCDIERLGLISVGGLSMDGAGVEGCQMKLGDRSVAIMLVRLISMQMQMQGTKLKCNNQIDRVISRLLSFLGQWSMTIIKTVTIVLPPLNIPAPAKNLSNTNTINLHYHDHCFQAKEVVRRQGDVSEVCQDQDTQESWRRGCQQCQGYQD